MNTQVNQLLKSRIYLKFPTQRDFADAIGEQPSVVSEVIRGRREISPHKQLEWAMALNCSVMDIFPLISTIKKKAKA
jgi:DNA-binding transcriptional regulator YdaS (Cro superfamily)